MILISVIRATESSHKFHFFRNFGKVHTDLLLNGDTRQACLFEIAGTANLPHFAFAVMWILYRDNFRSMAFARDWSYYELEPQKLMVNSPRGQQRSVWFFGVPWVVGVLLKLMQMLLHFLLSQSIFPVRIEKYDENGLLEPTHLVSNIGVSLLAMLLSLLFSLYLLYQMLHVAKMRLPSSAPIVGTCSAAISAACHPTRRVKLFSSDRNTAMPV